MVTSKGRINKFSEQNNNIVNISKKHESLLDIKKPKFIELNGVLYFAYLRGEDKQVKIYANHLKKFHGLLACFLDGIPMALEDLQEITKVHFLHGLKNGLCEYLTFIKCEHYGLLDLDANFWNGYLKWISKVDDSGVQIYSAATQNSWNYPIRSLLKALSKIDCYKESAKKAYAAFSSKQYSKLSKRTPRARLSNEDSRRIVDAAASEYLSLKKRINEGRRLIEEGDEYNKSNKIRYEMSSYASVLAYLNKLYPNAIPRRNNIKLEDPNLIDIIMKRYNGLSSFTSHCNLSARDCVPAILLLSFTFALNPENVLKLDFSSINEMEILGKKIFVITSEKKRSVAPQVFPVSRDFEVYTGITIGDILDFCALANKRIVNVVPSLHRSRVFLFCNKSKTLEPRGFGKDGTGTSALACQDIALNSNLKKFIKDNDLPYFTLGQIRPTILDELLVNTGDIKIAQTLGQQKNPWTLLNHYTSDGTKKRLEEKLGYASFILRERWWRTEGVIDPRSSHLRVRGGKSAATPGFYCLDPFDSPRPGQRKYRLCSAYGECPACMYCAASDDVSDVANYLVLRERLISAMTEFGEITWSSRWKPVLVALDSLLNIFSEEKIVDAKEFYVKLPALPRLE